jgi:beta-glucosidase
MSSYRFPENFLWGAGSSALQHEGSPLADGAGPSMMYDWAHSPGKVPDHGTFDVSADMYRRFRSDIGLMRALGLQTYNFETSWCRILPEGAGRVNDRGLDFYDELVDELLRAEIVPLCNLFVFDHPRTVQARGGWQNRDCASWFADYATIVFNRLGDRVKYWTTICEIHILNHFATLVGRLPPEGRDLTASLRAMHHLLLGQGLAVQAFRASGATGHIGNQHNVIPVRPASNSDADIAATRRANAYFNLLALDSQLRGAYPADIVEWYGDRWPREAIAAGDLATISAPIDFVGADYYFDMTVRHEPANTPGRVMAGQFSFGPDAFSSADLQAEVGLVAASAQGMRDALVWVRNRYGGIPILLLEIGIHLNDTVDQGRVNDPERIAYLSDLLTGAHRAISEGVDLRACYVWSFVDGWEFNHGLSHRYGLVHVDDETQARIIKASGHWYRDVVAANGFILD